MDGFLGFAEVAGAIVAAMGLAMGLEWLTLSGLLRLMPMRRDSREAGAYVASGRAGGAGLGKVRAGDLSGLTLFPR
jgi:hypothetical protein